MKLHVLQPIRKGRPLPIATMREEFARAYADHCAGEPFPISQRFPVLTMPGSNAKLAKGSVPTYGLSLAPADASGYELCAWRSAECTAACLGIRAGRSRMTSVQRARIRKTKRMVQQPYAFMRSMLMELESARRAHGDRFALRLNVLSDLDWQSLAPFLLSYGRWHYDYTKSTAKALRSIGSQYPLTLSHSGYNWPDCEQVLQRGGNVAVVFDGTIPITFKGYRVINGDRTDNRWRDPRSVIVGLVAKGNPEPSAFIVTH